MQDSRPKIAITLGDPAGVGPELVARVCHDPEVLAAVEPVVVGRSMLLSAGALACGLDAPEVGVVGCGEGATIKPGQPSQAGGRQAGAFIEMALEMCLANKVHAMVTGPISKIALKKAEYPDTGHTTLLGRLTNTPRPVMMMAGARLKVVLATVHKSIREVPDLLTTQGIVEVGAISDESMRRFFNMDRPRIAVAALNPHAGEDGMFGDEEERVIAPAVAELQAKGIAASGPHAPDTVFWRAMRGEYDMVLCMYHDQGLIPFKLRHFEDGVNVTLGLPIIRTSPDHGTAYDIAGQGVANPNSMKAAVLLAGQMARNSAAHAQ
jgi:4-hydroxythreonine-4-phosphate dehydrogenase